MEEEHSTALVSSMFAEYPDVVKVSDVAKMLNIGRNAAYGLVRAGVIPSVRYNRTIRVPKIAVINNALKGVQNV